jgi:predicted aspartyl protease
VSFTFNARRGLIIVRAELFGPSGSIVLRLALDTGATATMVNVGPLAAVGYDPSLAVARVQVTTGSGVEYVPRIEVSRIKVLGQERCRPARASTDCWVWIF